MIFNDTNCQDGWANDNFGIYYDLNINYDNCLVHKIGIQIIYSFLSIILFFGFLLNIIASFWASALEIRLSLIMAGGNAFCILLFVLSVLLIEEQYIQVIFFGIWMFFVSVFCIPVVIKVTSSMLSKIKISTNIQHTHNNSEQLKDYVKKFLNKVKSDKIVNIFGYITVLLSAIAAVGYFYYSYELKNNTNTNYGYIIGNCLTGVSIQGMMYIIVRLLTIYIGYIKSVTKNLENIGSTAQNNNQNMLDVIKRFETSQQMLIVAMPLGTLWVFQAFILPVNSMIILPLHLANIAFGTIAGFVFYVPIKFVLKLKALVGMHTEIRSSSDKKVYDENTVTTATSPKISVTTPPSSVVFSE